MALRDLAQKIKDFSPRPPSFCSHSCANLGTSLQPWKEESLPYSQKTEAHRREANSDWRAEEQEPRTHTDLENRIAHKEQHTHTHRPSPVPEELERWV